MRPMVAVTIILLLLLVPAMVGLFLTGDRYLATTHDIIELRVAIVSVCPAHTATSGYQRENPGPDLTLQFQGVGKTSLTLSELNFNLVWKGAPIAIASSFQTMPIPSDQAVKVTVETTLNPDTAAQARDLFTNHTPGVNVSGKARLLLANRSDGVWLNLQDTLDGIGCTR